MRQTFTYYSLLERPDEASLPIVRSGIAYLKTIWIIWMTAALVESLVFVSASGYHGKVVYGSFKRMKNDSSIEAVEGRSKKMNMIRSNLYSLGLQSIVSSVIGATHFTVSTILAFYPVHDPTLVGYVGVCAFPSSFRHAWTSPSS